MSERTSRNQYFREYRARNLEKMRAYDREHKRETRKLNPEKTAHYTAISRERKATRPRPFMCEVCDKAGPVVWDHCHATGHFRGWLCSSCNTALGLMNDSHERMFRLMRYLDRFTADTRRRKRQRNL